MKLSIYTFVTNGLFYDFHVCAMLRHHLPLADEVVVVEGFSTDGTYEAISRIDPKIQVHRRRAGGSTPDSWHRAFKNQARELCSGDWSILLDCDEFIPEWEFARLRAFLERTDKLLVPVRFTHFYGNYRVYLESLPKIVPLTGLRIHRNLPQVEVWGDGANVHFRGREDDASIVASETFEVHHFGSVRHPARLRQKWRTQARQHDPNRPRWDRLPAFLFNLFPHQWNDPDFADRLAIYDGPLIEAVRQDPAEFTRDGMRVYDRLAKAAERAPRPPASGDKSLQNTVL